MLKKFITYLRKFRKIGTLILAKQHFLPTRTLLFMTKVFLKLTNSKLKFIFVLIK